MGTRHDDPVAPLRPDEVEVRLLADGELVRAVPALATELALRGDFDLDTVSDFGIAVTEACVAAVANADADDTLVCRLTVSHRRVEVSATVRLRVGDSPRVGSLTLRLLRALTDSVDVWTSIRGDARLFHIHLAKSR